MNELSERLPWRKISIEGQDRSPGKRDRYASRFAAAAAEPARDSALSRTLTRSKCKLDYAEPTLSSVDFNFRAVGSGSESHSSIAKLFAGLIAALFLAVVIPWIFTKDLSELPTASERRPVGPVAFSGPARAGGDADEESTLNSRRATHGPGSPVRPGLCRPERLNAPVVPQSDSSAESNRTTRLNEDQWRPLELQTDSGPRTATVEFLSRQLQKIDTQQRQCELVLKLLDGDNRTFDGFVPDDNLTGVSYLARFQDKIIQLEISKRALAVRFTPNSREIRAIDLEIQGIRAAMRECLEANLRFLKRDKEAVLAQKAGLEGRKRPVNVDDRTGGAQSSEQSSSGRSWFSIRGGISALGRGLSRGLAYFTPSTGAEGNSRLTREANWSQQAASGKENRLDRKTRAVDENRAELSSPIGRDTRSPQQRVRHHAGVETKGLGTNQAVTRSQSCESARTDNYGRK